MEWFNVSNRLTIHRNEWGIAGILLQFIVLFYDFEDLDFYPDLKFEALFWYIENRNLSINYLYSSIKYQTFK